MGEPRPFSIDIAVVCLVDSPVLLEQFTAAADRAEGLCGLDCEWHPGERLVSIMQVAIEGQAWVLDLQWAREAQETRVAEAVTKLFQSPSVTKLGFAFGEDLSRLANSVPSCGGYTWLVHPYIELQLDSRGLASMMHSEVGLTLDKTLQCSAWGARPLSPSQLRYAAADAMCLTHLFKVLTDRVVPGKLLPRCVHELAHKGDPTTLGIDEVREAAQVSGLESRFEASSCGCDVEQGNVVCFVVKPDRRPVAVVTKSDMKISLDALAHHLGVNKARISMASAAECVRLFGFQPGNLPPIGLRPGVDTWLDFELKSSVGDICFSSGSPDVNLICTWKALEGLLGVGRLLKTQLWPSVGIATKVRQMARGDVPLRFVCVDPALNRLVQRLRVLDLDVVSLSGGRGADTREKKVTQLHEVGKLQQLDTDLVCEAVTLTSSRAAVELRRGATYKICGATLEEQFCEILAVFAVDGRRRLETSLDHRCHNCNSKLESASYEQIVQRNFKTAEVRDEYHLCSNTACEMQYWHSKTYKELRNEVRDLVLNAWF